MNRTRSADGRDPVQLIQQAIDSESITVSITEFLDRGPVYNRAKAMLAKYRELAASGGWPQVTEGPTLKPGMGDDRIPVIRRRLAITGDLAGNQDSIQQLLDSEKPKTVFLKEPLTIMLPYATVGVTDFEVAHFLQ